MALIVVDSDVLIDALRGREPAVRRVTDGLHAGVLCTTTVTVFELLSGVRTEAESVAVERLLAPMTVLPFDDAASREAARLRRRLAPEGRSIGMTDYLIAGICIARAAALLTRNRAHFERVPGLALATE